MAGLFLRWFYAEFEFMKPCEINDGFHCRTLFCTGHKQENEKKKKKECSLHGVCFLCGSGKNSRTVKIYHRAL